MHKSYTLNGASELADRIDDAAAEEARATLRGRLVGNWKTRSEALLTGAFFWIVNRSPKGRRFVFRQLFEYLARRSNHMSDWTQMNYGYAEGEGQGHMIALESHDEHERYCHQLYLRTANGLDLSGMDVVEVSCGRGGGAAFLNRHLKPRTITGIDLAAAAIDFCRRVHSSPRLRFLQGEAENLPLFDASADAVINVEASFCYTNLEQFFAEVHRVLRRGGYFLYADIQLPQDVEPVLAKLKRCGFDVLNVDDITANVSRALQLDAARRIDGILANAPPYLRHAMQAFAGTPGSRIPSMLEKRTLGYYILTLRKPGAVETDPRART